MKVRSLMTNIVVLCVAALATVGSAQAAAHPFTVHDMLAMDRLCDPQVSPDGTQVAFTVSTTDVEANRGRPTSGWPRSTAGVPTADLERGRTTRIRAGAQRQAVFPVVAQRLAQIWQLDPAGGEAPPVTELPLDIDAFELAAAAPRVPAGDGCLSRAGLAGTVARNAADAQ